MDINWIVPKLDLALVSSFVIATVIFGICAFIIDFVLRLKEYLDELYRRSLEEAAKRERKNHQNFNN